jgi:hypothetical protein
VACWCWHCSRSRLGRAAHRAGGDRPAAVWSADGSRVAFAAVNFNALAADPLIHDATTSRLEHPFAQDVFVVNSDGRGLRRQAELTGSQPSIDWSSGGESISTHSASRDSGASVPRAANESCRYESAAGADKVGEVGRGTGRKIADAPCSSLSQTSYH